MAATQLGTSLVVGATVSLLTIPNAGSYYVQSVTEGKREVDFEDTFDANGVRVSRTIFQKARVITMTLVGKTVTAAPLTDFPEGTMLGGANTAWFVASAPVTKTKSPHVVEVELQELFVNTA